MHMGNTDIQIDPTQKPPWWQGLAEQALAVFQAERLRAENMERIRSGLPPLTAEETKALAPTANVNVALPQDLKNALFIGGAAILGLTFFALTRNKRRRR